MKKIKSIILFSICFIFILFSFLYLKHDNKVNKSNYYGNLESFYSYEILNNSFDTLKFYITDQRFLNENRIDNIKFEKTLGLNIVSGFLITYENNLSNINYSTLTKKDNLYYLDNFCKIHFDENNYYTITYYNYMNPNELVPIIIYSFQLNNYNRIDFCFILTEEESWTLYKFNYFIQN